MAQKPKTQFRVSELSGGDPYKLTTGLIVPRPIGWVATLSSDGVPNLAPYSFFNAVSGNPPTFIFSPALGARKDTLANARETGEFTLNIVTAEVADAMNATAASVPAGTDEFALAGLTAEPSVLVAPPLVAECKANIECRVTNIVEVGHPDSGHAVVFGEGVMFHIQPELLDGTRIDQAELRAVGRHVGNTYSNTADLFDLIRPA